MSDGQTNVTEVIAPLSEQPAAVEVVEAAPAAVEDSIQIGDQVFNSQEEAVAYARELQDKVGQNDAYQQGMNDAYVAQQQGQTVTQPAAPEAPAFDEAAFYENPGKAMQEMQAQAVATATETIRAENVQAKKTDKLWEDFYTKYPKLRNSDSVVQAVMQENWSTLGTMPDGNKALDIVAQKATSRIQSMIASFNPGVEVERTNSTVATGASTSVTTTTVEEPVLDFTSQISQNYKL